jgi:hypothetical protein
LTRLDIPVDAIVQGNYVLVWVPKDADASGGFIETNEWEFAKPGPKLTTYLYECLDCHHVFRGEAGFYTVARRGEEGAGQD